MEPGEQLPKLKTEPKHGFYPWWPEDGDDWVHPDDVELARSLIPSPRVWRRDGVEGDYLVLHYGDIRLRVKRTLWRVVSHEGYDVGDRVEVLPYGMKNEACTGAVCEVRWNDHEGGVRYRVAVADGSVLDHELEAHELKHVAAPRPQVQTRIEPSGEGGEEYGFREA